MRLLKHLSITLHNQEGGSVSKEITGSVLTTSMTSRLASVVFKMAVKVVVEEAVKNNKWNLSEKSQSDFSDLAIIRYLL